MNKNDLKKIAKFIVQSKTIDPKIATLLTTELPRQDLIFFTRYLEKLIQENTVRVISEVELPRSLKIDLEKGFSGKNVSFEIDSSLGAGIRITINDTVIDLSMKEYLNSTIERLKQNL